MRARVTLWRRYRVAWLLVLALIQACGGDSGRSTGPTATTSVDLPVTFKRPQLPASCRGTLTATGPGPTQTVALPPLEVTLSLTAGVWTLTVNITCGTESASGQATVTVVPPIPISVNIQVTTSGMLTVVRNGEGTVTGPGINCGGDCSEQFTVGTVVTLTATPAAGSTFTGWSGGGCSGTGACQVTITTAPVTVTATFAVPLGLTVALAGTGSGTVTSSPAGIACPPTCSASFGRGTVVTLTAAPAAGSTFTGWSGGGCSGTGPCQVPITTAPTTVTATFARPFGLSVSLGGTGSGTVTSSPAGIACPPTCSASFAPGTAVTLTAAPAAGSTFTGWFGGGCSGTGPCAVTVSGPVTVVATFTSTAPPVTLTVVKTGTAAGAGTVRSVPAGIACGASCSATFPPGTPVTLTAASTVEAFFTGWSGGGCPASPAPCTLTLTASTTVTANFELTGTIRLVNDPMATGPLSGIMLNGPTSFGPISIAVGSDLFLKAPQGSYTIPAGTYYGPTAAACPQTTFTVVPSTTTTVIFMSFPSSPLDTCSIGLGLRRR